LEDGKIAITKLRSIGKKIKSEAVEQQQMDYARKYVMWFCEAGMA